MAELSVTIDEKKKELVIRLPMGEPKPSRSGKTLVIASTHGNRATKVLFEGKPIVVGANAYVRV